MDYETILLDITDQLATVTLNRPTHKNALTTLMRAEITDVIKYAAGHARAIVITGAGGAFCSGQDIGGDMKQASEDAERIHRDEYEPMVRAIYDCPVPTMAAVDGACAGAGVSLALACDVVIASENAIFMQAAARIGLMPDAGSTYLMPRQMGIAKAMGAALFADPITAEQASSWGLIYEVVPAAKYDAHWHARATALAHGPTESYKRIKKAIHGSLDRSLDEQLELESRYQGECAATRDFKEGVLAFSQKRAAKFEGR
ncbi:MAG: enoyl-CoA hydratase-related protein [Halocynthiibacter sp.]